MKRILLVEDNELNRDMLSRRLMKRGYDLSIAVDGIEGVDMTKSTMPDPVLMDMSLPGKDGWDATAELKADPSTSHIPIIGLSAHAMDGDRDRAMKAGCNDYDTKPVELDRLLVKIEALLNPASAQ